MLNEPPALITVEPPPCIVPPFQLKAPSTVRVLPPPRIPLERVKVLPAVTLLAPSMRSPAPVNVAPAVKWNVPLKKTSLALAAVPNEPLPVPPPDRLSLPALEVSVPVLSKAGWMVASPVPDDFVNVPAVLLV